MGNEFLALCLKFERFSKEIELNLSLGNFFSHRRACESHNLLPSENTTFTVENDWSRGLGNARKNEVEVVEYVGWINASLARVMRRTVGAGACMFFLPLSLPPRKRIYSALLLL